MENMGWTGPVLQFGPAAYFGSSSFSYYFEVGKNVKSQKSKEKCCTIVLKDAFVTRKGHRFQILDVIFSKLLQPILLQNKKDLKLRKSTP